jgi:hypothetical protein
VDGQTRPAWEAEAKRVTPLHAGACGACSNARDLTVYHRTRHTLTRESVACAYRYLAFGRKEAERCVHAIGFSTPCSTCWVDNIACTATHCRSLCLRERLLNGANNTPSGKLSPCLACDEEHCGAPFIKCAGANRRRSGITSDIDRDSGDIWPGGESPALPP